MTAEIDAGVLMTKVKDEIQDYEDTLKFESVYIKEEMPELEEIPEEPSSDFYSIECHPDVKIEPKDAAFCGDVKTEMPLSNINVETELSAENNGRTGDTVEKDCSLEMACLQVFQPEHSGDQPVICYRCNFKASTIRKLKKHMLIHMEESNLKGVYNVENSDVQDLTKPKPKRGVTPPLGCNICDYRTWSKYHLCTHVKKKHLIYRLYYVCSECFYCATSKNQLIIHIKKHSEVIKCTMCNFRSSNKSSLTRHMRRHDNEISHECNLCDYTTFSKENLITHLNRHSAGIESMFRCDLCHYKTLSKYSLSTHMRKHTGEKPYCCYFCNYRASRKSYMMSHMRRIHNNEKMLTCNICLKYRTTDRNRLDIHMCKHTGEIPFCCYYCPYKSKQRACLVSHMNRHLRTLEIKCKCGTKILDENDSVEEFEMESMKIISRTISPIILKKRIKSVLSAILEKGKIKRQCVTNNLLASIQRHLR